VTLQRKAIRKAIVQGLMGRTFAGTNVGDGAPENFRPSVEGPAALYVHALSDVATTSGRADSGRIYSRDLELAVAVWIEEETTGQRREDLMDDLCGQVEILVEAMLPNLPHVRVETAEDSEEVGGNPSKSGLERVEIGFDNQGRALLASARVVFLVTYETQVDPSTVAEIVPLDGATVRWDFPFPDGVIEARDEIATGGG